MAEALTERRAMSGSYPIPVNEAARLQTLYGYRILDTEPEDCYDEAVFMVQRILSVPIALLSFVDADRQWFKAKAGITFSETSRQASLCAHVVASTQPLIVEDASRDDRFKHKAFVTGEPYARFYAAVPLVTPSGLIPGTLCAVDSLPRRVGVREIELMKSVAKLVVRLLELR